jgi:hypothetical protein
MMVRPGRGDEGDERHQDDGANAEDASGEEETFVVSFIRFPVENLVEQVSRPEDRGQAERDERLVTIPPLGPRRPDKNSMRG